MELRRIEDRSDVRGVIRAHGRAWRAAYDGILPPDVLERQPIDPDPETVDGWEAGLRENREGVRIAVDDGRVCGFVDLRWEGAETKPFVDEGEADLKAIYVDPDRWGEGIGTSLLERGLTLLPDAVDVVRLEAFADNDVGARFYERRGFEATGRGSHEVAGESYPTTIYSRAVDR